MLKSSFSCKAEKDEGIVSYFGFFPTKQMNEEKASLPKFGLLKNQSTRPNRPNCKSIKATT
ncbi:hypothetical protein PEDI_34940 [Persicobacter diffluens]|uniref:Uncharacterized protein n=1 Tax=Persicobacter diffluens TaxID=981 RepID=A0AAN4W271_9BACT|nr:hypothetical protein PEDI_34940 [Persicobacter diffluens]